MYAVGVWKIIFLWHQRRLGSFKIPSDPRAAAAEPDFDGRRGIVIHRFSDIDRGGHHLSVHFPVMIFA